MVRHHPDANRATLLRRDNNVHERVAQLMRQHACLQAVQQFGCRLFYVFASQKGTYSAGSFCAHARIAEPAAVAIRWPAFGIGRNVQFLLLEPCLAHEAVLGALHNHADVAAIQVAGLSALAAMAAARTCGGGTRERSEKMNSTANELNLVAFPGARAQHPTARFCAASSTS